MNAATSPLAADSVLMTVTGSLVLIIFVMVALAWLFRRSGLNRRLNNASHAMTLVASQSLGTRERVVLMDVGNQRLVLGVTATQITCLATQERPAQEAEVAVGSPVAFSAMLDKFRQKYRQDAES